MPGSRHSDLGQCQSLIATSSGEGDPVPVSIRALRLRRNTAHLVLQWERNSTGSAQPSWVKRTIVNPSLRERRQSMVVPIHSGWSVGDPPPDQLARRELDHLHVEPALGEPELDLPAEAGVAVGVGRPPARQAVDGGEGGVDVVGGRRLDADAVMDVGHGRSPCSWSG